MEIKSFSGRYAFLSNFYHAPFELFGMLWPTVEHFYQAGKIDNRRPDMWDWVEKIRCAKTPGEAKRLGRALPLREGWEGMKEGCMRFGLKAKFEFNPDLGKQLMDTSPSLLIEGNTWGDRYWGVCCGEGQNRLGVLLMELRRNLLANSQVVPVNNGVR